MSRNMQSSYGMYHMHHSLQSQIPTSRGRSMDVYSRMPDSDRQSAGGCMAPMYPRPQDIYGRMPDLSPVDRFPMALHHSNLFGNCLDDGGALYMNSDTTDINKGSPPLTPSSRSIMKHDVGACLSGYSSGYGTSDQNGNTSISGRPFHSPSGFGESMLDQLQVVPGHVDSQLQSMYPSSVYGGPPGPQSRNTASVSAAAAAAAAVGSGGYYMSQGLHIGGGGNGSVVGGMGPSSGSSLGGGGPGLHHAGASDHLHGGTLIGPGADCDTRELEAFAEHFKQRRIKIGVTQADVGAALGKLKLPGVGSLSQSTICRFESLTLSHNNMVALKPVLQAWLEEAEAQARDSRLRNELFSGGASGADRKRKRTSIATPEKRSLEAYFAIQPRPSGEKIAQIAEKLDLKKNVVRVWFCNQRQKQKRMKFAAGALQGH